MLSAARNDAAVEGAQYNDAAVEGVQLIEITQRVFKYDCNDAAEARRSVIAGRAEVFKIIAGCGAGIKKLLS